MKFDFDTIIPRQHTNSYKWDSHGDAPDVIQMWVADMDFRTAPCITEALAERVSHGIFGYTSVPESFYNAITGWFLRRHNWGIDRSHILYTSGVVPAISAVIKALAKPGEGVIVTTPVYNCFFSSIRNNGCVIKESPMIYADGRYAIDFDHLRQLAADPRNTLLLLCNPHNPGGRIWTPEELAHVADICRHNNVTVISDEIHCELTYNPGGYTPFAVIAQEYGLSYVSCVSPSKAFNTAGLQIAAIISPDSGYRRRIDRAINDNEVCDVNPFGVIGLTAAYNHGEQWLNELIDYLKGNIKAASAQFRLRAPQLTFTPLEATYLAWIDCRALGKSSCELAEEILHKGKVRVSPGSDYGGAGEGFIRINLAAPRSLVEEGIERILNVLTSA